ncbi:antibiotic biosynthesis monooxygenase [Acuticoccus sp. I52.16.1]|uniref:antibiotic biosynthesis monooxygenase family protein n=1 Tax=Acuticoccus sp. I52.16.1 TaxID=2928472 RepID=UPI001FD2D5DC|nr:antibiotic biosynthesis monooxygenase [Acuticoccus sp. I52.16.1]UOM33914.1 antibiotic biosynthesis monooxygenase [Acuticoccus sp. I52.16.1]
MFIAMNRFKVRKGSEDEFQEVWLQRDVKMRTEPGFVEFHLLRGPEHEDHTLFSSHTIWESEDHFIAWTKGEAFKEAHRNAPSRAPLYIGGPQFEGFRVVQTVTREESEIA